MDSLSSVALELDKVAPFLIKLFEIVAHEGLNSMAEDDKKALLEANAKKVPRSWPGHLPPTTCAGVCGVPWS